MKYIKRDFTYKENKDFKSCNLFYKGILIMKDILIEDNIESTIANVVRDIKGIYVDENGAYYKCVMVYYKYPKYSLDVIPFYKNGDKIISFDSIPCSISEHYMKDFKYYCNLTKNQKRDYVPLDYVKKIDFTNPEIVSDMLEKNEVQSYDGYIKGELTRYPGVDTLKKRLSFYGIILSLPGWPILLLLSNKENSNIIDVYDNYVGNKNNVSFSINVDFSDQDVISKISEEILNNSSKFEKSFLESVEKYKDSDLYSDIVKKNLSEHLFEYPKYDSVKDNVKRRVKTK